VGATDAEFLEKEFEPVFTANDIVNLPKFNVYLKLMIDGIAGDAFSATTLPPIKLEDVANEEKIIRISRERYSNSRADVEEKIRRWTGMLSEEEKAALRQSMAEPVIRIQQPAPVTPERVESPRRPDQTRAQNQKTQAPKSRVQKSEDVTKNQTKNRPQKPVARVMPPRQVVQPPVAPDLEAAEVEVVPTPTPVVSAAVEVVTRAPLATVAVEAPATVTIPAEKVLYDTLCVTCEKPIQVPFKPDGSRPTFCKDCLKDYQRAVAKERQALEQKAAAAPTPTSHGPAVFTPKQAPMKLGQMQYVAPKKFQPLRGKSDRDTQGVRDMVNTIRPSGRTGQ
jgi:CxxC-x17-CxxC domain-containing protein